MGYYAQFSPTDQAAQRSLAKNRAGLTSVSPLWYSLKADGSLVRRGYDRTALLSVAGGAGLPVLALVTNSGLNDTILLDPAARDRSIEAVYRLVKENHLAGVNIDFEGLSPSSSRGLTTFMRRLYERLKPEGYLVTIAVAPRQSDSAASNDWVAAYDYAALAPWVDYLVLMAYDQHWQTGPAGPVASLGWVEETVRYAVSRVPREKVLLGLAGYGYDWGSDGSNAVVPAAEAARLAQRYGTRLRWDDAASEATFTYWQGKVKHTVWVENSYAVELRLALASRYRLAGVALWRLGQEEDRLWTVLRRFAG
jgi:spore germination protein YaaH